MEIQKADQPRNLEEVTSSSEPGLPMLQGYSNVKRALPTGHRVAMRIKEVSANIQEFVNLNKAQYKRRVYSRIKMGVFIDTKYRCFQKLIYSLNGNH